MTMTKAVWKDLHLKKVALKQIQSRIIDWETPNTGPTKGMTE